ncbi:MAG: hypothetical protein PF489_04640 [Salinivirgaceae bacterium]|jgi:hypothetical protein|nr:hypothetical protein [Salinivirgaceae bacterium]
MKKDFLIFGVSIFMGLLAMQSCEVEGCTDSDATNYDADATSDDGSCDYIHGCTDAEADNYNPAARIDDGSCEYFGCTDESATNYDPDATVDDGSCEYIYGCMDPDATNYNPNATMDDGSCEYEGQAMWWINSELGVGNINVYFRGYYEGEISSYYYYTPSCGATGCVTATYDTGSYLWYARADDGTYWSGSWITIYANDCSTMKLTLKKDGKPSMELVSGESNVDAIPQPIAN